MVRRVGWGGIFLIAAGLTLGFRTLPFLCRISTPPPCHRRPHTFHLHGAEQWKKSLKFGWYFANSTHHPQLDFHGTLSDLFQLLDESLQRSTNLQSLIHSKNFFDARGEIAGRPTTAVESVTQLSAFLRSSPKYPVPCPEDLRTNPTYVTPPLFSGRGIVIVAGGVKMFQSAYSHLRYLRSLGCTLPIELWHTSSERPNLEFINHMQLHDVTFKNIDSITRGNFHSNYLKIAALIFSSFEEVILMDSHSIALENPTPIFNSEPYKRYGVLLWPDYWQYDANQAWVICDLLGAPRLPLWPTHDGGQVVFDKRRIWTALLITFFFTLSQTPFHLLTVPNGIGVGDKEFLPFALYALNQGYWLGEVPLVAGNWNSIWPLSPLRCITKPNAFGCFLLKITSDDFHGGNSFLHRGPTGSFLFLHPNCVGLTTSIWSDHGDILHVTAHTNTRDESFLLSKTFPQYSTQVQNDVLECGVQPVGNDIVMVSFRDSIKLPLEETLQKYKKELFQQTFFTQYALLQKVRGEILPADLPLYHVT